MSSEEKTRRTTASGRKELQEPVLPQGAEPVAGDDQVVVQLDPHQLASASYRSRELEILGRGLDAAAGMVVRQDETAGQVYQSWVQDLLTQVVRSISVGGKETLYSPPFLPCGSETHEPFRIANRPLTSPGEAPTIEALWGTVSSWTAFAYHMLDSVFEWGQAGRRNVGFVPNDPSTPAAAWVEPVLKTLRSPKGYTTSRRIGPTWIYFSALPRGISILRLPKVRARALNAVLAPYRPSTASGGRAMAVFANGNEGILRG